MRLGRKQMLIAVLDGRKEAQPVKMGNRCVAACLIIAATIFAASRVLDPGSVCAESDFRSRATQKGVPRAYSSY